MYLLMFASLCLGLWSFSNAVDAWEEKKGNVDVMLWLTAGFLGLYGIYYFYAKRVFISGPDAL